MNDVLGTITFGRDTICYEVRFLKSRQTLTIEVHPDGHVLVRAPLGCPETLIAERVQKRADWICRQLAEFERYRPRTPARQYISGESHLYLGRQYRLKLITGETSGVKLTRGQLLVSLSGQATPDRTKELLHRWYLHRARSVFSDVLDSTLLHFKGVERPNLIVRTMQSRWGSFSNAGTMTLNVNLVRAARPCIEYVVTHELCHTQHRDHDGRFFKLLGQVMPDWEKRKRQLETSLL